MQPILPGNEIKVLDKAYIHAKGLTSYQLMEKAASAFCHWFLSKFDDQLPVHVICGPGNNGGDGLAIARILNQSGRMVFVYYLTHTDKKSSDYSHNYNVLPEGISKISIQEGFTIEFRNQLIIDGLFGVGINRELGGLYADLVSKINSSNNTVIAIDIPSGLPSDEVLCGTAVKAEYTLSFQFPKKALLFPEHAKYVGELVLVDIGIDMDFFDPFPTSYYWLRRTDLPALHKSFHRFSHKGDFGKVLLIGGSEGKMGSIVLSTLAALRTGSGLVSSCVPKCGVHILQTSIPESMVQVNEGDTLVKLPVQLDGFNALGIGPGLGNSKEAVELTAFVLQDFSNPIVIDADAINVLSVNPHLFKFLEKCILTPHVKEFERLVGACANHLDRLAKARSFAVDYKCIVVLKGANTVVSLPDGRQVFNSTGNQYMATGGSGDALTGIITSFLGQGYSIENAALCGVFHHGLAGEMASRNRLRGTIATDIIDMIPETFSVLGIL